SARARSVDEDELDASEARRQEVAEDAGARPREGRPVEDQADPEWRAVDRRSKEVRRERLAAHVSIVTSRPPPPRRAATRSSYRLANSATNRSMPNVRATCVLTAAESRSRSSGSRMRQ